MELEQDQLALRGATLEQRIKTYHGIIQSAEKYERMKEDPDVQEFLKDVKDIADFHDQQIKLAQDSLWEKNKQEREELFDQMFTHQIMKDMAIAIADRPKKAVAEAKEARENLDKAEKELSQIKEATHA